jgi:hypothetical protein
MHANNPRPQLAHALSSLTPPVPAKKPRPAFHPHFAEEGKDHPYYAHLLPRNEVFCGWVGGPDWRELAQLMAIEHCWEIALHVERTCDFYPACWFDRVSYGMN